MDLLVNTVKIVAPFAIPTVLNVCTHLICENFGCDEWYSLLGFNLACNTCIDAKKILKDQQTNMYWSIGSVIISKMNLVLPNLSNN